MAVLTPGKKGQRFPSLRGRVEFHARKGKIVAQKWRRKRGRAQTPGQRDRQEWFRQANVLAKYADGRQQALSRCAMEHLPVRPFDALLAAMAGRLWAVEADDGRTLYSMAARGDVSKNLDVLNQEPGRILIRGPEFWEAFDWGLLNQYIASQGPDVPPIWKDLPGGGGGGPAFSVNKGEADQTPIPHATFVKLTWPAKEFDTNNDFASDRFTPTVAGKYFLGCSVEMRESVDQTLYLATIYKNGSEHRRGIIMPESGAGSVASGIGTVVDANGTTDYFEVFVFQNSGVAQTINGQAFKTHFTGMRIGP